MNANHSEREILAERSQAGTPNSSKSIPFGGYCELMKPRLSLMSVITALFGYLAALPDRNLTLLFHFLVGTALCAGGAAALNQWYERDSDALMKRTKNRPLPSNQISPIGALAFGTLLSLIGVAQLFIGVNPVAATIGALTIVSYVAIYTPMKKVTRWATEVGAVSGALPPLIGWAAAEGEITTLGWILFAILAVWQIPHFMAIAWTFREDYEAGGFPMLSVIDKSGKRVARWSLINTILLLATTALPIILGYSQWIFGLVALGFGIWILKCAYAFLDDGKRDQAARKLFLNSIMYLPAVMFSLVIDRWILG